MDHHFQLQMMFLLLLHRALLLMGQHLVRNIVGVITQHWQLLLSLLSRLSNSLVLGEQKLSWSGFKYLSGCLGKGATISPFGWNPTEEALWMMESYWRSFIRRDFIGGFINPLTLLGDLFSRRFALRCMLNGYANIKDNIRSKCSVVCACRMTPFELTMWPLPTVHISHPSVGHGEGECMYVRVPCAKMQGCHVVCSSFWISRTSDLQLWVHESQQVVQSFLVSSCCDCVVQV